MTMNSQVGLRSWKPDKYGERLQFQAYSFENGVLLITTTAAAVLVTSALGETGPRSRFAQVMSAFREHFSGLHVFDYSKKRACPDNRSMMNGAFLQRLTEHVVDNPHYSVSLLKFGIERYGDQLADALLNNLKSGRPSYQSTHCARIIDDLISHFGDDSVVFSKIDEVCAELEAGLVPTSPTNDDVSQVYAEQTLAVKEGVERELAGIARRIEDLLAREKRPA